MANKPKTSDQLDKLLKTLVELYDIPKRTDIERLIERLDKIEAALSNLGVDKASLAKAKVEKKAIRRGRKPGPKPGRKPGRKKKPVESKETASGVVLDVIKMARRGADFSRIKKKTGFEDKKLRNIIFRLKKNNLIKPLRRGVYVSV